VLVALTTRRVDLKRRRIEVVEAITLEDSADRGYLDWLTGPVRDSGGGLAYVELFADQDIRPAREGTPLRSEHKRSKRDVEVARQRLNADAAHTMNTNGEFCYPDQHLRLDNSHLDRGEAAIRIADHLGIRLTRPGPDEERLGIVRTGAGANRRPVRSRAALDCLRIASC
jgi:hypothetical protein